MTDHGRYLLFDKLIFGYLAYIALICLAFGRPLSGFVDDLIVNALLAVGIVAVVHLNRRYDNGILRLLRYVYPALFFLYFYRQTGGLIHLFFPGFLDYHLTTFEKSILGINFTLWIDQNLVNVWLNEIITFCYVLYYPMIPTFLFFLFAKKRYDLIASSLVAICITFFISYSLFFLYPIEGPRYFFADQYSSTLPGFVFRPLVEYIMANSAVHGGCMPSSHVAVALVMLIFCLKYYRRIGILMTPIVFGLALGTFYGRFHYVSDVVVGAAIGAIVTALTLKYYRRPENADAAMER
ncbi:MAG: phosphatase PAP2 family protein [candidate division Zixibacteria bacterium]|nr:phosphatase PAP2 family protein [candidate division Zixibacteria bacterium]